MTGQNKLDQASGRLELPTAPTASSLAGRAGGETGAYQRRGGGTYLAVPEVRSQDDTPLVLPQQHLTQASLQDAAEFGL